jgi:hypothetical protein
MTDTINNQIPLVPENTIDPAAGLNLSLNTVDALLQVLVQTVGANTPPTGVEGQRFIVGTAPTGAWAGQANKLARFLDGAWQFFDARYVLNAADGLWYVRSASSWAPLAGGGGGEANTASNLGAGEGLYASKVGVDLRFKSLVAGTNVSLSSDGDTVTIDATGGGGGSGTVTSVALSAPTGFDVSGSPVTASGTLALSFSTGYSLPTNANQANWSTAFGWGDHALAGYEKQLVAGANITIDRTDPDNPIISSTAAGGGGGDVVGPASATNNGVALFDGITGKLIKDGGTLKTLNGESLFGAGNIVIPGGAPSNLSATAWVEATTGNDSTGAIGDIAKPFLTINAALDALPSTGGRIFLSRGTHAPIKDDYLAGTGLDPASKLKSNVTFIGAGMPELNSPTAPTGLNALSGTVIQGPVVLHSTRHNVKFLDLGVDSGLDVCTALYAGAEQEGIGWYNVGQIDALPQARGAELHNVSALCKSATALVHAIGLENVTEPFASNIAAYFGTHGLALKAIGGLVQGLRSYGHSGDVIIIKESNLGNNTAPCKNTVVTGVVGGSLSAGDTPVGVWLDAVSSRDLTNVSVSGVSLTGISSFELKATAGATGKVRNIRLDGFTADGPIRTSLTGLIEKNSVFLNGDALGALALTDGATIQTDASAHLSGGVFSVTPGAVGRSLANPTNLIVGKTYLWLVNTGSGTITSYGTLFSFLPGAVPVTSSAAGVDVLSAVYDGTKLRAVYSKP